MNRKELALERLHRNGLLTPFPSMDVCVRSLVGIQSQMQQFSEISIWNRCAGSLTMKDLGKAYHSHRLINLWGQRNTLHMYVPQDWDMICDLYHNRTYAERLIALHPEIMARLIDHIRSRIMPAGVMSRTQIREFVHAQIPEQLAEDGIFFYCLSNYVCANGLMFGIPAKPGIKNFAARAVVDEQEWQWKPEQIPHSLDSMMLRYFQFYGPATLQDFCHWSGLPAGVSREALTRLRPRLMEATMDQRTFYTFGNINVKRTRKLSLLGKFDPLFVSYRHKDWIVNKEQEKNIWRSAAHVEAIVLDGVNVAGTWRHVLKGKKMTIRIEPMTTIANGLKESILAKSQKIARFWQKELDAVVYE